MQAFLGEGRAGFAADGVARELLLQLVVGIVRDIAQPAAVHDGRFLSFRKEAVELHVVAGGDDQGVDRPLVAVDFDAAVLDDAQVDLNQILLVLEDLVAEVDAAAGHPRQRPAPQIEAVGVVRVRDVQQPLNGFFAQQVHRR